MKTKPLIFFLHMPKVGGSTMSTILRRQYKPHEVDSHYLTEDLSKKLTKLNHESIKVIHGHYYYGLHQHFKRPYSYFTILRDPIDRTVSLYYYLRSIEGKDYDKYREMTLQQFVENKIEANIQTILLAGEDGKESLLKAVRNLTKMCDVVGTTDQFNETLYLLKKRYSWQDVFYEKVNVTKQRKQLTQIPQETIEKIKEVHYKDVILYHFAEKIMKGQLSSLTEKEKTEMEKFIKLQTAKEVS